jgi:hypothetical protein
MNRLHRLNSFVPRLLEKSNDRLRQGCGQLTTEGTILRENSPMKVNCPVCGSSDVEISTSEGKFEGYCPMCEMRGTEVELSPFPTVWLEF